MFEWPQKLTDALADLMAEDGLELKSVELLEPGIYKIRVGNIAAASQLAASIARYELASMPAEQAASWGKREIERFISKVAEPCGFRDMTWD